MLEGDGGTEGGVGGEVGARMTSIGAGYSVRRAMLVFDDGDNPLYIMTKVRR